ncbi:MAG TPA: hypothetical protein VE974_30355 [Thermoanaerobaculia bacterium]|nr:hypothetical protein [Thermoanaerobaculia bacterium]
MTLPLLALGVAGLAAVAWALEFRHREESLPALGNRRHIAPFVFILLATLFAVPVVLGPLVSVAEWPRSTQVAWTAVEALDRTTGGITVGGPEHAAAIGWPNGAFWPEVRVEPDGEGLRLRTRGGNALVRVDGAYVNGDSVTLGGGGKQLGKFSIELARRGWLRRRKLLVGRTPMAEPLIVLNPPPVHATRARSLDSLMVSRLNDLRRSGTSDLATIHALEQWASSLRVLMPDEDELRLIGDREPARELSVAKPASEVEILWPRRRLVMRLMNEGGAARLTFEPPWTRTTSLPPFEEGRSTLTFAREPSAGANTFLLPLGHGAADFRHNVAMELSPDGLARFRDGADLGAQPSRNGPRWMRQPKKSALGRAFEPNRSLSSVRVPLNPGAARGLLLTITTVRDLPTPRALLIALICAWVALAVFVGSIAFGRGQRLRLRDLWCIGGILVAVWSLLLVRVLLAVRYLLTPTAVDEVTAKGLAGSLAALVIVPGFIALAARLWLHHRPGIARDRGSSGATIFVAVTLVIGAIVEFVVMPRQVLPNLSELFLPSAFDRLLLVVYGVAALAILDALGKSFAAVWQWPYRATFEAGRTFWQALNAAEQQPPDPNLFKRYAVDPGRRVFAALLSPALKPLFLGWCAAAVAILLLSRVAPEYVRQIVAPFWMVGIPALLLLARPVANAQNALSVLDVKDATQDIPAIEPTLADTIATVVVLLFAPVAIMLGVLGDFGAIYSVLAFWFPLALLLLLTSSVRLAATLLVVLATGVTVAYWALLGSYAIAPGMTEHILSRVEVMKHGSSAQEWLLDLEAPSAGDARSVTAVNVRNALVHEWEHMAMVRKGGWIGLGFNHAPASQSFIRQDTIQYDSVYSFFIAGEHGLLGGLFLLAMFAAPVALLLMRRTRLRVGDLLAIAIAASFLGEAVAHAAMNVSQLWFSGRNLPLLATASNSDVLRWALLLGVMCQALLWSSGLRADAFDTIPETAVTRTSVFDPEFGQRRRRFFNRAVMAAVVLLGLVVAMATRDFAWFAFALTVPLAMLLRTREYAALALLPALVVGVLVVRGSLRALGSSEFDVLTWSRLLKRVDELHAAGMLRFDPQKKLILFRDGEGQFTSRPTGSTLLEAEVLRFNSLPANLRIDGGRAALPASFFNGVTDPGTYYTRMFELWQRETELAARTRPSVFAIRRVENDAEGVAETTFEVTGNPDYNIVHSFDDARAENEVQPVSIRGRRGEVPLLGRAWAMGHWLYAPTQESRRLGLGWMTQYGDALLRVRPEHRERLGKLTLDADLQRLTQATVDAAGREIHSALITSGAPVPLPPRVAFTIMRGTTGEVLAMSSWPRAAASDNWSSRTVTQNGQSWVEREPPYSWLSSTAPRSLASRQAVDHNFAAIEMGSAAKPFWATAALTVHPALERLLWVRNGDCDRMAGERCYEREMFGVEMGKGWQVSRVARWVDFTTYLAASDNRYHTRLGMLALARAEGDGIADDGRGRSPSGRESLTGRPVAWDRYPALSDATGHTRDKPRSLANLHEQQLAVKMRDLFGIRTGAPSAEGELRRYHVSFWSGDESDDLRTREALEPLAIVSPEAVDLGLNRITGTRDFIAVLLGGGSSRWSNIDAAAAFSSWAMRRPVVAHIVDGVETPAPLASRKAAFDKDAVAAAEQLDDGLQRVLTEGTALHIRPQLRGLRERYDVYAKTGTLATVDPARPTSRILLIIVARDDDGRPRNAVTLSFVAERTSPGFATAQLGRFINNHEAELVRLLEMR